MIRSKLGPLGWTVVVLTVLLIVTNAFWAEAAIDQALKLEKRHVSYVQCNESVDTLMTLFFELARASDQDKLADVAHAYHYALARERAWHRVGKVGVRFDDKGIDAVEIIGMRKRVEGQHRVGG